MINIVVTSKPCDGLLYYSYEYTSYLNALGIETSLIIVCHNEFTPQDYTKAITEKYIHCENVEFDNFIPDIDDVTLILGRSMMTLAWKGFGKYTQGQQATLRLLFANRLISIYSENHPVEYPAAVKFFTPKKIIDLCDTEIYPNGTGKHFEKTINFSIYKPYTTETKFKYLFLGTNKKYYETVESVISDYPDHGILTYNQNYINLRNNNIFAPVKNLFGLFETYVYTKNTFDPAPRIFQECKYFGKEVIYLRDKSICDGGSVYWKRTIKEPNVTEILKAYDL
jgi:hypothetical protein